jgi:hypothetical protein
LQEAHATTEPIIKIKYRYHSETVTVFSKWSVKYSCLYLDIFSKN